MNTYTMNLKVNPDEIDAFGHVNNVAYLRWFNAAASRHCEAVGYGGDLMWKNGFGWIIRSHAIEYLKPIKPYEEIKIITYVHEIKGAVSLRKYQVVDSLGNICAEGETRWVWVDYKSGRPCRVPKEVVSKFGF